MIGEVFFGEYDQPTQPELLAIGDKHAVFLMHGPTVTDFGLKYVKRDQETDRLSLVNREALTPELLAEYDTAFRELVNSDQNSDELKTATGLSSTEICQLSIVLSTLANVGSNR